MTKEGDEKMDSVLLNLAKVIEKRMEASDAETSYVASLHRKGLNKILEKVGEEAVETVLAAKDAEISGDKQALIYETADLWFHSLVMLAHLQESPSSVLAELERRFDQSGIDEKASRQPK